MKLTISLEPKELDYLANVLAQRPWAEANPLMTEIQKQVQEQAQPQAPVQAPMAANGYAQPVPAQ